MPRKRKEEVDRDIAEGKINKPHQRFAANARERSRMRVLSKAFSRLKTTLPWVPPDTKLSKLDTLRLASSYIAHLKQILDHEETTIHTGGTFIHPLNLTWPFTFSSRAFGSSPAPSPLSTPGNKTTHGNNNDYKTTPNNNATTNYFSKNSNDHRITNNNDMDNSCNIVNINNNNNNNNNNRTFNSGALHVLHDPNDNDGIYNMAGHLHGNHRHNTLLVNGGCNNEGLSPISDTSSINDHEIVSH